jgi:hypothetical protein
MAEPPMIDPHGGAEDVISDVPELTIEEIERRIGARERARRRRIAATPARIRTAPSNRRVILWRDSATILIFVIVALLAARFLLGGDTSGLATASPTPDATGVELTAEPSDTGFLFTAPPTPGPAVDPSSIINATPTPIPVITLPPPTPRPPKTPAPTKTPGPGATPPPTPGPTATPAAPIADFSCPASITVGVPVTFNDASTGSITSWLWDFGDGVGTSMAQNPQYTYTSSGQPTVKLTVTGPGGSATHSASCTVNP